MTLPIQKSNEEIARELYTIIAYGIVKSPEEHEVNVKAIKEAFDQKDSDHAFQIRIRDTQIENLKKQASELRAEIIDEIKKKNAPEIEKVNSHLKSIEAQLSTYRTKLGPVLEALTECNRVLNMFPNRPVLGSEGEALIFARMLTMLREALSLLHEIMGDGKG